MTIWADIQIKEWLCIGRSTVFLTEVYSSCKVEACQAAYELYTSGPVFLDKCGLV